MLPYLPLPPFGAVVRVLLGCALVVLGLGVACAAPAPWHAAWFVPLFGGALLITREVV